MSKKLLTNQRELYFFSVLGLVLLVLLTFSLILDTKVNRDDFSVPAQVVQKEPFKDVDIKARAAYVYDTRTGEVIYAKNEDERLPLASLTKVMSALVALDIAPGDSSIVISGSALQSEGDSGLYVGEKWSLGKLIDFSLTSSSNDGIRAVALALGAIGSSNATEDEIRSDFVRMMNTKAEDFGMKNTYYFNETGLDETTRKGGAYGTAKDMAILFDHALRTSPEIFSGTRERVIRTNSDAAYHTAKNTFKMVESIPGIKASKTGYTDIAGGNLVIAFDPEIGRPIIVSVLGSTQEERFSDVRKLVEATIEYISQSNNKEE